jgi:hypothetical protein
VLFAYEYDLTDMGLSAMDQVDRIEIANMVASDRIDATGTLIGSADPMDDKWVTGQFGGAIDLDGADDYGTFMSALFDVGSSGTLSFWTNMDDTGTRNQFFEGPGDSGMEFQYRSNSSGQFYGRVNDGGDFVIESGGAGVLHNGIWVNMQYTWDETADEMHIYRNGVEVAYLSTSFDENPVGFPPATDTTAGVMNFGFDPGSGRHVNGRVDDIGFFNAVLDSTDRDNIRTNGVSALSADARLVAHWDLDTTTGNTESDNKNGIVLTINNNEPWAAEGNVLPESNNPYAMDNPGPDPGPLASFDIPYGNSTYDPDPLYLAVIPDLVEQEIALGPQEFTVTKDFDDDDPAFVDVTLTCTSGTPMPMATLSVNEGTPGVWSVEGADPGVECTAVESGVPAGYVSSNTDCQGVAIEEDNSCTITNTARVATFSVTKTYSDGDTTPVAVTLNCTGINTAIDDDTQSAEPGVAAVFVVRTYEPGDTCTAVEDVPSGYTWSNPTDCQNVGIEDPASCNLNNVLNEAQFTVFKDFSDDNPAAVDVTLTCSSGTVVTNPLPASESTPAEFDIEGFEPGATCTASEAVPDGYDADISDCQDNDPLGEGCTIINSVTQRAVFRVTKDFSDDNPQSVNVVIDCNTGLILMQDAEISEFGDPFDHVDFVVTDYTGGNLACEIYEDVPAGYVPDYSASAGLPGDASDITENDDGCQFVEVVGGMFQCDILNQLQPVDVVVEKEWIDDHPEYEAPTAVEVTLVCDGPITGGYECDIGGINGGYCAHQQIDPSHPGEYEVLPHYEGTTCSAIEEEQVGVLIDQDDCESMVVLPGEGESCVIVNTRLYEGIPTLNPYGLLILTLLMMGIGAVLIVRRV